MTALQSPLSRCRALSAGSGASRGVSGLPSVSRAGAHDACRRLRAPWRSVTGRLVASVN